MSIFKVNSAILTNIKRPAGNNLTVFIKGDETYLGLSRNYDKHGNYNNDDNSLYKVSDRRASFYLLSATYSSESLKRLINEGEFIEKDIEEAKKARELYSGNLYNDKNKKEGLWVEFENTTNERATGIYINGEKDGEWRYYSNENLLKLETYKDNLLNGSAVIFYNNNQIEKSMNYEDGVLNGPFKEYDNHGNILFEGSYEKGLLNGKAREYFIYTDGGSSYSEGYYVNDEKQGLWKEYDKEGNIHSTQHYTDGREDGTYKQYTKEGILEYTEEWEYGEQLNAIDYYPNGKIQGIEQWEYGVKNGIAESFYESGELKERCNFKNNELDGPAYTYDKSGNVIEHEIYSDGKLVKDVLKEKEEKNPWENDNDIENDNPWEDKLNNNSSDLER